MRFALKCAVLTQAVLPGLEEALKLLTAENKLKYEWTLKVVQSNVNLGGPPEYGAVLYPTRRSSKSVCQFPPKYERRIVLRPLPDRAKVKTSSLEIGFARDRSHAPLLGTEDCPQRGLRGLLNGDWVYIPDFFAILEALSEILTIAKNTSIFPEIDEVKKEPAIAL